ncbi:hypothetical protein R3P38DRAFT_3261741 [Favolaschia claudopus]|uniref:Uncharacterized protein n=1 Tax=Favolaschia claudopus TaxID=2862362 RepID=A0AAW0CJP7_9AGAR
MTPSSPSTQAHEDRLLDAIEAEITRFARAEEQQQVGRARDAELEAEQAEWDAKVAEQATEEYLPDLHHDALKVAESSSSGPSPRGTKRAASDLGHQHNQENEGTRRLGNGDKSKKNK